MRLKQMEIKIEANSARVRDSRGGGMVYMSD